MNSNNELFKPHTRTFFLNKRQLLNLENDDGVAEGDWMECQTHSIQLINTKPKQ
ncbi:hypothetical protein BB560_006577 [Smittium megazygosporum]|uniref:Uncharacterized protein n=1 Tax=Smittium megazygosporum TaxID=133381 RepID=A0A2T9Y3S1_9FUNG|nr:hypothetical protein BB560_006577 [Smittium megazygosporum]